MERREQISVPINPGLREEIERVAAAEERSVAQQVRKWIAEGLRAAEQHRQVAA